MHVEAGGNSRGGSPAFLRNECAVSAEVRPVSTNPTGVSMGLPSLSRITSSPTASRMICKPMRSASSAVVLGRYMKPSMALLSMKSSLMKRTPHSRTSVL